MNELLIKSADFTDLGLIAYEEAWSYQTALFNRILETKARNRNHSPSAQQPTSNHIIFCEHPHVFTLGKSGDESHLLVKKEELSSIGATYYQINRGGDITYHGPGQIVGYPVLDLENFFTDIHRYMRLLEESVIQTLACYGLSAGRIPGMTGVWIQPDHQEHARKICALGVRSSRWVTMHGFAFNVNTDLRYFQYIVPCGIPNRPVTSLEKELGGKVDISEVKKILKEKLGQQFEMEWL